VKRIAAASQEAAVQPIAEAQPAATVPSDSSEPRECVAATQEPAARPLEVSAPPPPRHIKEPPVFGGDSAKFKEWAFAMDLALKTLQIRDPTSMVDYAAGYLTGNARLWFMSARDANMELPDWPSLRNALEHVYGPLFDTEQARIDLFAVKQQGEIDLYITDFSRLSLQVPQLDDHSRAILFTNGLIPELRGRVLQEHPLNLDDAIRAARAAQRSCSLLRNQNQGWSEVKPRSRVQARKDSNITKLTSEERERMREQGRCFACRKVGHLARDCHQAYPNEQRQ